ncbi:TIGR02391 family protein [Streptomyces asiaticus]|uniref:TIGR02391 family protein n=1 Tax=Streptomyces asiaticus TaxID=114695 RepID=UPI0038077633
MATYSADYLKRLMAAVERFEEVFGRWMETQEESDHVQTRGLYPTVWTKDGQDQGAVRMLELDVAEAAGAAARAVAVTGTSMRVAGLGVVDPIENWSLMSAPRAIFTPQEVRATAARVRGRLSTMISEAEEAAEPGTPGFAPSELHEVIWTAAAAHWTTHQYRVAVREASEVLTVHWKERLGRNDATDTSFWQQTRSSSTGASWTRRTVDCRCWRAAPAWECCVAASASSCASLPPTRHGWDVREILPRLAAYAASTEVFSRKSCG